MALLRLLQLVLLPIALLALVLGLTRVEFDTLKLELPPTFEADLIGASEEEPSITRVEVTFLTGQERTFTPNDGLVPLASGVKSQRPLWNAEVRVCFITPSGITAEEAEEAAFSALSVLRHGQFLTSAALHIEVLDPEGKLLSQAIPDSNRPEVLVWNNQETGYTRYSLYGTHWEWVTHVWTKVEPVYESQVAFNRFFRAMVSAGSTGWSPLPNQDPNWTHARRVIQDNPEETREFIRFGPDTELTFSEEVEAELLAQGLAISGITAMEVVYSRNAPEAPLFTRETGLSQRQWETELKFTISVQEGLSAQEAEDCVFLALQGIPSLDLGPLLAQAALHIEILGPDGTLLSQAFSHANREGVLIWKNQETGFYRYSLYGKHWVWVTHYWGQGPRGLAEPHIPFGTFVGWFPLLNQDPRWTRTLGVADLLDQSLMYARVYPDHLAEYNVVGGMYHAVYRP